MVPKRVGDELRRRRLTLRLKQADVARQIGTTRAYISAVERGVNWDPDADKLVLWAKALSWSEDHILRKLGRISTPVSDGGTLTPEIVSAIKEVVAAGIRDGFEDVVRLLGAGAPSPPDGTKTSPEKRASN